MTATNTTELTKTPTVGAKTGPDTQSVTIDIHGTSYELPPGRARALANELTKKATLAEDH